MQRQYIYKLIRKGVDVIPQSDFEKNYFLAWRFKNRNEKLGIDEKLKELRKLSRIKLDNRQPYKYRRKKKHSSRKKCFACWVNKAVYQHHIITLNNGGYDNGINRIPICEDCHKEIHPWLKRV